MPGKWHQFRALPADDRQVLLAALVWLPAVQIGLRLVGFRPMKRWLQRLGTGNSYLYEGSQATDSAHIEAAQRVGQMVNLAAGRRALQATCLPRSLVTWWLLRQRGIESLVIFGVPGASRYFTAHAWVEVADTVINDTPDVRARFGVLEAAGPPG